MAFTYPLTMPPTAPSEVVITPLTASASARSIFTFHEQTQVYDGQLWQMELNLPPLEEVPAQPWIAFFLKLNGREGTFLAGDPSKTTPRGSGGSEAPLVDNLTDPTANQIGANALATNNWTASQLGVLLEGDVIQVGSGVNSRFHRVLTDVDTDGSGRATIDVWPSLRFAPNNGDPVVVTSAKGIWKLSSPEMPWSVGPGKIYNISFSAVEALEIS